MYLEEVGCLCDHKESLDLDWLEASNSYKNHIPFNQGW